jgi:inner membrane protease ATP23
MNAPENAPASDASAPMAIGGGFNIDYGILLCANQMKSQSHLEDTLAHEMVHAWDHLKFQIDQNNMRHQACTEIRAATISGECRITKEVWGRGQWKLVQQMQECVKRRAVLSMMGRPQIRAKERDGDRGKGEAERVVGEVWDNCFQDIRPFDEIFR